MEILSVAVNDGPVLEVTKPCNDRKKLSGGHYTEAKSMWHEAYLAHFTVHQKMYLFPFFTAMSVYKNQSSFKWLTKIFFLKFGVIFAT